MNLRRERYELARLVQELVDPDENVRKAAIENLRREYVKATPLLEAAAQGEAAELRLAAEKVLKQIKTETLPFDSQAVAAPSEQPASETESKRRTQQLG